MNKKINISFGCDAVWSCIGRRLRATATPINRVLRGTTGSRMWRKFS